MKNTKSHNALKEAKLIRKGKHPYFAFGGEPDYEAEHGEVIVGDDVQSTGGRQIASNIHKIEGRTHEEFNPNTVNGTGEDVSGGDFVYSNRLSPDGKKSFAGLAELLGKRKAFAEKKQKSNDYIEKNTGVLIAQKIDTDLKHLANEQEALKAHLGIGQMRYGGLVRFAPGGPVPKKKLTPEEKAKADYLESSRDRINKKDPIADEKIPAGPNGSLIRRGDLPPSHPGSVQSYRKEHSTHEPDTIAKPRDYINDLESRRHVDGKYDGTSIGGKKVPEAKLHDVKPGSDYYREQNQSKPRPPGAKSKEEIIAPFKPKPSVPGVQRIKPPVLAPKPIVPKPVAPKPIRPVKPITPKPIKPDTVSPKPVIAQHPIINGADRITIKTPFKTGIHREDRIPLANIPVRRRAEAPDLSDTIALGLTGASYMSNKANIARMKTSVPAVMMQAENYQYNDQSANARSQVNRSVNNVLYNPYSSTGQRMAAFSKGIETMSQINNEELNRKRDYDNQFQARNTQIDNVNAQTINEAKRAQIDNENQQRASEMENNNALFGNLNEYLTGKAAQKGKLKSMDLLSTPLKTRGLTPSKVLG